MAGRNATGSLGYGKEDYSVHLPWTLSPSAAFSLSSNSAWLLCFCRVKKVWGLLEGVSSLLRRLRRLLQTLVPGLPETAVDRRR